MKKAAALSFTGSEFWFEGMAEKWIFMALDVGGRDQHIYEEIRCID